MVQQSRKALLESRANRPNKFEARRQELAAAALAALAENGYANTSLRDIAAESGFSLGTLHYYFEDKADLIAYCTRNYKLDFIETFNTLIANADQIETLIREFAQCSVRSVKEHSHTHRLWYDIKSQALFDQAFIDSVTEIDAMLADMVAHLVRRAETLTRKPAQLPAQQTYWTLDGFFQNYLRLYLNKQPKALAQYEKELTDFLQWLLL